MNTSSSAGWNWSNAPVPSVCVPVARKYVVPACRAPTNELSVPAGIVTAPAGAVDGPSRTVALPQTDGPGVAGAPPVAVVTVDASAAVGAAGRWLAMGPPLAAQAKSPTARAIARPIDTMTRFTVGPRLRV